MEERTEPIRIIAVDGGGVGGVIPARVIERLAQAHPGLLPRADLLAGTSTGGLVALALARGLTATQVGEIYRRDAKVIFGRDMRRWRVEWLYRAKYSSEGLKRVVAGLVGEATLKELAKPVLIPVVALKRPDGKHVPAGVFLSTAHRIFARPEMEKYRSGDWRCVDAALGTSAAPTYFPAHRARDPRMAGDWLLWDGGLVANDPALSAICELSRFVPMNRLSFRVLSLGTGYRDIPVDAGDWGQATAAAPIISTLLDASVGSTAFYLRQLFGDHVVRASPELAADYGIDDAEAVEGLVRVADAYCDAQLRPAAPAGGTAPSQPGNIRPSLLEWLRENW